MAQGFGLLESDEKLDSKSGRKAPRKTVRTIMTDQHLSDFTENIQKTIKSLGDDCEYLCSLTEAVTNKEIINPQFPDNQLAQGPLRFYHAGFYRTGGCRILIEHKSQVFEFRAKTDDGDQELASLVYRVAKLLEKGKQKTQGEIDHENARNLLNRRGLIETLKLVSCLSWSDADDDNNQELADLSEKFFDAITSLENDKTNNRR